MFKFTITIFFRVIIKCLFMLYISYFFIVYQRIMEYLSVFALEKYLCRSLFDYIILLFMVFSDQFRDGKLKIAKLIKLDCLATYA
jgi:hypothetical protein